MNSKIKYSTDKNIRANRFFNIIKQFSIFFPDEFEKCDIKICGHCGGIGFKDKVNFSELCFNCGGIGYVGFKKIADQYVCRTCNGYGCILCNQTGVVDWISHANGRDITKNPRI